MKDNAMNLTEARHLLSVTEKDDLHTLKKKYHRLMSECHPDALGSERPEHVERAFRERKVDLYFRLGQTAETYRIPDRNLQIAELLVKKQKL